MKILTYIINILILVIISITPNGFHNDQTRVFDFFIIFSLIANFIISLISKGSRKIYFTILIITFVYCLFTISSNDELDTVNFRINSLFKTNILFTTTVTNLVEEVTILLFLIIVGLSVIYWATSFCNVRKLIKKDKI